MKKPVVDYRQLRPNNITEPRFRHLLLLLGWVGYFALYFLTENLIPAERCTPVWMPLDDKIPFMEIFLIPYVFWYALIVFSLGWFMFYDVKSFKSLQIYIMITQALAMLCYIIYPTRQDLRPAVFPNDNFLTDCVKFLYAFDTSTGVCPSLHCAYSFGIASTWLKTKGTWTWWKVFVVIAVALICASTCFIKQHSAVDFFAAIPVGIIAEIIVFGPYWKQKIKKHK